MDIQRLKEGFVSVPCRGLIFLNKTSGETKAGRKLFPSPVGDLYFSIGEINAYDEYDLLFPSPVGDLYFSIWINFCIPVAIKFPSPVGDLYFSILIWQLWND